MKKNPFWRACFLALALGACGPADQEASSSEALDDVELSEAELKTAASELIDQEAMSSEESLALETQAATQSTPISFCGYPPYCPSGMQPLRVGCDAGCYVRFGYDCFWGYNRIECLPVPPQASITATPQTVTVTPGALGSTRICWNTQSLNYPVWIRVRVNGGPGQLFTKESDSGSACENAGWIQAGNSYQFSIHDDNADASPIYTSVTVTGVPGTPPGGGNPDLGPCEPGGSGICPPGRECRCGESYCLPVGSMCP